MITHKNDLPFEYKCDETFRRDVNRLPPKLDLRVHRPMKDKNIGLHMKCTYWRMMTNLLTDYPHTEVWPKTDILQSKVTFPSCMAHRVALISVSLALSQTPVSHCKTMNTRPVHHVVCLFTPQLSPVLSEPTHRRMASLSGTEWLAKYRDGLPVADSHPSKY